MARLFPPAFPGAPISPLLGFHALHHSITSSELVMVRLCVPRLMARTTRSSLPSALPPADVLGPDFKATARSRAEVLMDEGKDAPTCGHEDTLIY